MSPRWSGEHLSQVPQAQVEPLAPELEPVERVREDEHRDLRDTVRDEDPAAEVRAVAREYDRVDQVLREPDRGKADGDEHDAEERVHRAQVCPLRAGLEREAEHEVRAVEEEEDKEEHELVLAPQPPMTPRDPGPDRAGQEDERPEDETLVDADVALEVGALVPLREMPERLPRAAREARVRRDRDRDVEVEASLREA